MQLGLGDALRTSIGWVGDEPVEIELSVDAAQKWSINGEERRGWQVASTWT